MAAARPIILAAAAANDPVSDARCGRTVEPDDPAALAQAIRALRSATPAERARLGANGRAYVERVHSYESLTARYVPVLRRDGRMSTRSPRPFPGRDRRDPRRRARPRDALRQGARRALRDPPGARHRTRRRGDRAGLHVRGRPECRPLHRRPAGLGRHRPRRRSASTPPPSTAAIGPRTRAILAQNTFGLSADLDAIMADREA